MWAASATASRQSSTDGDEDTVADDDLGERVLPFSAQLVIDREDFREEANRKYKRLVLGDEVRLRNSYVIRADEVVRDVN